MALTKSDHTMSDMPAGDIVHLSVEDLHPAPDNPRTSLGKLTDLSASIASVGILHPLVVSPRPQGGYVIVCGERRWAAAVRVGLHRVPCVVREFEDAERQEVMLVENLQRSSLTKLEEAQAYDRLLQLGLTQREIGSRVGKSQSHISRRLLLLTLPAEVQQSVETGKVSVDQALGYRATPPEDAFDADEALQRSWIALRHEIVQSGNERLVRLLRDFANAYVRAAKFVKQPRG